MERPDLDHMRRGEARAYIEHLEAELAATQKKLAVALDVKRPPVKARRSDPDTSHKAALEHYPKAGRNRHKVLLVIENLGTATSDEVLVESGVAGAWKRISELAQGGWITSEGNDSRPGKLSGKEQQVYSLTDKGRIARAREREGMPPVQPTRRDGSPAKPPHDLIPAGLFDTTGDEA